MKAVVLVLLPLLFFFAQPLSGQWEQTKGPSSAGVTTLLHIDPAIYAGTDIEGVFRSTDDGATWDSLNVGLEKTSVHSLAANANYLFAGVDADYRGHGGVYRIPLDGTQWTPFNAGIGSMTVSALLTDGSVIYAGTIGFGVFKSTDNGETWVQSNAGMGDEFVNSLVENNGVLFAAGSNNLYRSDDDGATWYFTDGGQYFNIFSLFVSGNYMYAGGFQGIIRSTDFGTTWSNRIDILILNDGTHISGFAERDSVLFATTSIGPGNGVIQSTDHGITWTFRNTGIESVSLNAIVSTGTSLVAGGSAKGILLSHDDGATWIRSNEGFPPGGSIRRLLWAGGALFAGTGGDGVYRTTDEGSTWESASDDPDQVLKNEIVPALAEHNGIVFAGTAYEGIFRSTDNGLSWQRIGSGIPSDDLILSLTSTGNNLITGTGSGIYYSSDEGENWFPTNVSSATVTDLAADSGIAYALVSSGFGFSTGIYRSTDNGISWNLVFEPGTITLVGLTASGARALTGSFSPGGFRSTDFGLSWNGYDIPDANGVYSLAFEGETIYAGCGILSQGVYQSTDFGITFSPFNEELEPFTSVEALAADKSYLFAGTNDRAVWRRLLTGTTGVISGQSGFPDEFRLDQNFPNPFNPATLIAFQVPRQSHITLALFDLLGRRVATIVDQEMEPGTYRRIFDAAGLASGVYIYRMEARESGSTIITARKMVILK